MSTPTLQTVILQNESSFETRSIQMALMLLDDPPRLVRTSTECLTDHKQDLVDRTAMAVGSVEFIREAFAVAGIVEPINLTYHNLNYELLRRHVSSTTISTIDDKCFVKPVATKLFTGFIYDPLQKLPLDIENRQQYSTLRALSGKTRIWRSEIVSFACEWRYYILDNEVYGKARYDPDGADDAPQPDESVIESAISAINLPHPFALDVGVLDDGRTAVVEINDAWAIGLYGSALTPKQYFNYLIKRWQAL